MHACPRVCRSAFALLILVLAAGAWPATAERIEVDPATDALALAVSAQGPNGVELHYRMQAFGLEPVPDLGGAYRQVTLPGVMLPNDAGAPDLAGCGRLVAIPRGATAEIEILRAETRTYSDLLIAPAPVLPRENDPSPLVYDPDPRIYSRDALYPAEPVIVSEPRKMRGVDFVALGITPFQYNPVTRELTVYTELDVRIRFVGGHGEFGDPRLRSRHWESLLRDHLINYDALPQVDFDLPRGDRDGYEYVILTPDDPDFVAWGDSLAAWRKLQGISSAVFTTTDIGGTSASAIEAFLDNAYNTWSVPPAAFLILADYPASGIPGITSPIWGSYCVSDNIYADVDGDDLPDMAHGRITARDAAELETMIGKMLDYERNPVTDAGFYNRPIMAGGWQTERWFILCTEVLYGFQANALGKEPVREYAIYSGTPGSVWSTATNTSFAVDYWGPNGLGYIPSTPSHLTDWSGNATRINNDINNGAYILMHRDHGMETGWGEPYYTNSHLSGLNNSKLPFVFSINCLTGRYDWGGECFTEAFHRMSQGALGLIAASEVSYSFVNDTFVWGIFDSMWPEFDPGYGASELVGADNLRTAFAQTSGKYYLAASSWPYNSWNKDETNNLFHHHGDAFMTIYSEVPQALAVAHDAQLEVGASAFGVQADAGAIVALTVGGEIAGVAEATGAWQQIPVTPQTAAGTLRITVTLANHFRYDETVPIVSGSSVTADFTGTPLSGCAPLAVSFTDLSQGEVTSWSWDFGDGGSSTEQHPSHSYVVAGTYSVSLTASGPGGSDVETKSDYVSVAGAPAAAFNGTPTSGFAPLTVEFTDLTSGGPTAWSWDFGDGGTSTEQHPSHTYTAAGTYTVSMSAANACGSDQRIAADYVQVGEAPPYVRAYPQAETTIDGVRAGSYLDLQASDDVREAITEVSSNDHPRKWHSLLEHHWTLSATPGTSVTFYVEASRPANSDGDDFRFEYSTDGAAYEPLVTVASSSEQIYSAALPSNLTGTVTVRVIDTDRTRSNQSFDTIYIDELYIETTSEPQPPVADFAGDPTAGVAPLTVQFSDLSSGGPTNWSWDFGDGGTATAANPSHVYAAAGTYTVSLTVSNAQGSDSEVKTDYVTVTSGGSGFMHVENMEVMRKHAGPNQSGQCRIWIFDQASQPVAGATVYATADGPVGGTFSGTTGDDGTVFFETGKTKTPSGEWCFEVTDVAHASYMYDPGSNLMTRVCESGIVEDDELLAQEGGGIVALSSGAFRPHGVTALSFDLQQAGHVKLEVFDVTGVRVALLLDEYRRAGRQTAYLESARLASGVYFWRLDNGRETVTSRMMVVK